ncbi:MAG TPA: hypothetical protein VN634_15160 [Candidatus Limnocylindrales bacterium]|nr:hypothetical protein [Candidatus Limnocylindrales bacterium]
MPGSRNGAVCADGDADGVGAGGVGADGIGADGDEDGGGAAPGRELSRGTVSTGIAAKSAGEAVTTVAASTAPAKMLRVLMAA